MADISDRVLKRRQKDLSDFVEKYQDQLDKSAGQYAKEMVPIWKRLKDRAKSKTKSIYKQVGALDDPKKITNLMRQGDRMDALANSLAADIKRVENKLQPYYSANIGYEFEKSYYSHLFGMEQAAKISVNTPMLSMERILGVLANPWLDDGGNYSDRLRANTALLASKMKDTINDMVVEGWGWNEAARRLGQITDEGYFNAVRLIRTEANRAAALGASYSYMENADVLDGKRWNATLDARTAPKDAKNDGKLYDLDYDTPENAGIAGQRIPNHPNCRCKWSPVLSALGVSEKERIARGNGDGPDQFGERTYTKARTYEEYAKERGLPSLDKRLEVDNPKSYLRPGETIADLNKKVGRYTVNGKSIVISKNAFNKLAEETAEASTAGTFTPASTLAEAKREARKTFKKVDLNGVTLDQLNEINRGIAAGRNGLPLEIDNLDWIPANKNRGTSGLVTHSKKDPTKMPRMSFRKLHIRNPENYIKKQQRNYKYSRRKVLEKLEKQANDSRRPDWLLEQNREKLAKAKEVVRWSTHTDVEADDFIYTLTTHETGHGIYNYNGLADTWEDALEKFAVKEVDRLKLSEYGASSSSELFAETNAMVALDRKADVPETILKAYEETINSVKGGT